MRCACGQSRWKYRRINVLYNHLIKISIRWTRPPQPHAANNPHYSRPAPRSPYAQTLPNGGLAPSQMKYSPQALKSSCAWTALNSRLKMASARFPDCPQLRRDPRSHSSSFWSCASWRTNASAQFDSFSYSPKTSQTSPPPLLPFLPPSPAPCRPSIKLIKLL